MVSALVSLLLLALFYIRDHLRITFFTFQRPFISYKVYGLNLRKKQEPRDKRFFNV